MPMVDRGLTGGRSLDNLIHRFYPFRVGRPRNDSPKVALEAYKKRYGYYPTLLALDVGDTTGVVMLNEEGIVVGYLPKTDFAPPVEGLVSFISEVGKGKKRGLVVLVEGGYCPAYKPVFYSGAVYGAALLQPSLVCVELIPPHLKPPVRKEKSAKLRLEEFVKTLSQYFSVGKEYFEAPFAHSASAYGLIEYWLRKEGLYDDTDKSVEENN